MGSAMIVPIMRMRFMMTNTFCILPIILAPTVARKPCSRTVHRNTA